MISFFSMRFLLCLSNLIFVCLHVCRVERSHFPTPSLFRFRLTLVIVSRFYGSLSQQVSHLQKDQRVWHQRRAHRQIHGLSAIQKWQQPAFKYQARHKRPIKKQLRRLQFFRSLLTCYYFIRVWLAFHSYGFPLFFLLFLLMFWYKFLFHSPSLFSHSSSRKAATIRLQGYCISMIFGGFRNSVKILPDFDFDDQKSDARSLQVIHQCNSDHLSSSDVFFFLFSVTILLFSNHVFLQMVFGFVDLCVSQYRAQ